MFFNLDRSIKTAAFGKVTQKAGYWHNGKRIPFYLLICCVDGYLKMEIDQTIYIAEVGDVILIPQNTPYIPLDTDGCTYYFFHFFADDISDTKGALKVLRGAILPEGQYHYEYHDDNLCGIEVDVLTKKCISGYMMDLFTRISEFDPFHNPSEKLLIDNYLREILILISREIRQRHLMSKRLFVITNYIKQNISLQITLSLLSKRFALSEAYIARIFRKELGVKPSDYINRIKIACACDLLVHTDLSITEISEKVGFASLYYFSRIFKKLHGISPSELRTRGSI